MQLLQGGDELFQLGHFPVVQIQQHFCFYIQQMGGHLDKLAGHLQVHGLHGVQIGQILVQNVGNIDVPDGDFVFGQEHQNQAQGTFKVRFPGLVLHHAFQTVSGIIHCSYPQISAFVQSATLVSTSNTRSVTWDSGVPRIPVATRMIIRIMPYRS